jgi:hypothetical protein
MTYLHATHVRIGEIKDADDVFPDAIPSPKQTKLSDATDRISDVVKRGNSARIRRLRKTRTFRSFFVVDEKRICDSRRRFLLLVVDVGVDGSSVSADGNHAERNSKTEINFIWKNKFKKSIKKMFSNEKTRG